MGYNVKGNFQKVLDRLRIQKRRVLGSRQATFSKAMQSNGSRKDDSQQLEIGVSEMLVPTSEVPLYLQTDGKWAELPYGTDGRKNIAENGCAIVTLAMVGRHYGLACTPKDVREWAQNDYYLYVTGTSWNIFTDFAQAYQLVCEKMDNNIDRAKKALLEGRLVIASFQAGRFTDEGHMVLLTGYRNGKFSMNDPNDDEKKLHRYQWFPETEVAEASLHFWALYPPDATERIA